MYCKDFYFYQTVSYLKDSRMTNKYTTLKEIRILMKYLN